MFANGWTNCGLNSVSNQKAVLQTKTLGGFCLHTKRGVWSGHQLISAVKAITNVVVNFKINSSSIKHHYTFFVKDGICKRCLDRFCKVSISSNGNKQSYSYDLQPLFLLLWPFLFHRLVNPPVEFHHRHIGPDSDSNAHL